MDVADVYAKWINAHGGINGHPLQIINCENHATENGGIACARQAISDNVVAAVGWSWAGGQGVPYLASGHVAWLTCCALDPQEFTGTNSFPMSGYASSLAATPLIAGKLCKSISAINLTVAQPSLTVGTANKVLQHYYGKQLLHSVLVPPNTSDFSSIVAQATEGNPDCIMTGLDENSLFPLLTAMQSLGQHQRIFAPSGNLDPRLASKFPSQLEGSIAVGPMIDYNTPQWATYRAAVAQYHAFDPARYDYTGFGPQSTWVAMNILENTFKTMMASSTPITAANVMNTLSQESNVNSNGYGPPMDFTKQFPVTGLQRSFNNYAGFSIVKNGKLTPYDDSYHLVAPGFFLQPLTDPLFKQ
jgi:hypothetical protein